MRRKNYDVLFIADEPHTLIATSLSERFKCIRTQDLLLAKKLIDENNIHVALVNWNDNLNIIEILDKINLKINIVLYGSNEEKIIEILRNNYNIAQIFFSPFKVLDLEEKVRQLCINDCFHKVPSLLSEFEFNKASVGYTYVVQAISSCIEKDCHNIINICEVYKEIATISNIDDYKIIKWNVEKAIRAMNKSTDKNILETKFKYTRNASPKMFINSILEEYYKSA